MFPLIEVSGPARERGQQYGLQARARIERSIATYASLSNHFLAPAAARHQAWLAPSLSTVPRLERISALTGAHRGKFSPADLHRMLRDESDGYLSICRRRDPSLAPEVCIETVASVVMDLGQRMMHIAPDVPSQVDYLPVALDKAES